MVINVLQINGSSCLDPLFEQVFVVRVSSTSHREASFFNKPASIEVYKVRHQTIYLRELMNDFRYTKCAFLLRKMVKNDKNLLFMIRNPIIILISIKITFKYLK